METRVDGEFIRKLEDLTRSGQFSQVEFLLSSISYRSISRVQALALANLARRAQLGRLALRIISPFARPGSKWESQVSVDELLEYAIILLRNGARVQSHRILDRIDPQTRPTALLYRGHCFISEWNYKEAIPILENFTAHESVASYQRLVGNVNLASGYVNEEMLDKARSLLTKLKIQTKEENATLLYAHCCELLAQVEIRESRWAAADSEIEESRRIISMGGAKTLLQIEKWTSIMEAYKAGRVTPRMNSLRETAMKAMHWESVRDIDFYRGCIGKDSDLLSRVYFGTPFPSYKDRVLRLNRWYQPPKNWIYSAESTDVKKIKRTVDFEETTSVVAEGSSGVTRLITEVLKILLSDFYRPFDMVELFSLLYPNEYFIFPSSGNRARQAIFRFKEWVESNKHPLSLGKRGGDYFLEPERGVGVHVQALKASQTKTEARLESLRSRFEDELFSLNQVRECFNISFGSAQALLASAVAEGLIEKVGAGPKTKYRMVRVQTRKLSG